MPVTGAHAELRLQSRTAPPGSHVTLWLGLPPSPPIVRTAPGVLFGPAARWGQISQRHRIELRATFLDAPRQSSTRSLPGAEPARIALSLASAWDQQHRQERTTAIAHADLPRVARAIGAPWLYLPRLSLALDAAWRQLEARVREQGAAWRNPPRKDHALSVALRTAAVRSAEWATPFVDAPLRKRDTRVRWHDGELIRWQVRPPRPVDPPSPGSPNRGRWVGLNLACPPHAGSGAHVPLLLGRVTCSHLYPRRKVYHVVNSAAVVRLPDRAPIAAGSISLAIDNTGYAWQLSMELLDAASFALLRPTLSGPREVEVTLNGHVWTALVDGFDESGGFVSSTWRVTGRSRAAYLGDRYAPTRSRVVELERLAQQLAAIELDGTGWELDWTAEDWVVPAGVWTFDGLTPIAAVQRIAAAVGAFVQADRVDDVLHVRPQFPYSPWTWADEEPTTVLLPDYCLASNGRYDGGDRADMAVVRGERAGVQVRAVRAGTAGEISAGVIVDSLITTVPAARARAIHAMASTGPRQLVDLEMPLFPGGGSTPGVLEPGQLVQFDGAGESWRAVTTGCRISAQRSGAQLTIRQALTVERHLDYA